MINALVTGITLGMLLGMALWHNVGRQQTMREVRDDIRRFTRTHGIKIEDADGRRVDPELFCRSVAGTDDDLQRAVRRGMIWVSLVFLAMAGLLSYNHFIG